MYKFLLYLTNNGPVSQHEVEFDLWFYCIITGLTIVGIPWFIIMGEPHWSVLLIIWYIGYWDQIRFNRAKQIVKKKPTLPAVGYPIVEVHYENNIL